MSSKSKYKKSNNKDAYWLMSVLVLSMLLVISFIAFYLHIEKTKNKTLTQFFEIKNVSVKTKDYAIATNLSIGSSVKGNLWLKENEKNVKPLFENILFESDISQLDNSQRITFFQSELKKTAREKFPQAQVKELLITDFVYQSN